MGCAFHVQLSGYAAVAIQARKQQYDRDDAALHETNMVRVSMESVFRIALGSFRLHKVQHRHCLCFNEVAAKSRLDEHLKAYFAAKSAAGKGCVVTITAAYRDRTLPQSFIIAAKMGCRWKQKRRG